MAIGNKKQQKISTEELAKTQVLNLEDVQKLAKYERIVSKKPALMVALVGLFSIIVGVSAQTVVSLSAVNEQNVQPSVSNRIKTEEVKNVYDTVTCEKTDIEAATEISIKTIYAVDYNGDVVEKYTKTTDVNPTSTTSVNAITSIQNGMVAFKAFESKSIDGYKIIVSNKESGYEVLTTVEPSRLDITKLDPIVTGNQFVSPNVDKTMTKETLKSNLTSAGYTCK